MLERLKRVLVNEDLASPGDRLLVAVSGGADSMALLHLLVRLAPDFPLDLVAAHLDHRLRPDSADDADFVARHCGEWDIPFILERRDVAQAAREAGCGLEVAGRRARREFLGRVAREHGCASIALAHHADDQAETVLFRVCRGTGLSGVAGMQVKNGLFIRPLLHVRRAALRRYLEEHAVVWRDDASNADPAFARNRIRHRVLPLLEEINPRVTDALVRLGRQARDEEVFWERQAATFLKRHGGRCTDGYELDLDALQALSRAEQRRVLRAFLKQLDAALPGISARHVAGVLKLALAQRPQADLDLPGMWVGRRYRRLVCAPSPPATDAYEIAVPAPGEYRLPTGDRLIFSRGAASPGNRDTALFDAGQIDFPLVVRSPRPGDRFQPSGMRGRKRLKDYFIDAKVDRESRRRAAVVWHGEVVIWLAGWRRCDGFRPAPGGPQLKIELIRQEEVPE